MFLTHCTHHFLNNFSKCMTNNSKNNKTLPLTAQSNLGLVLLRKTIWSEDTPKITL